MLRAPFEETATAGKELRGLKTEGNQQMFFYWGEYHTGIWGMNFTTGFPRFPLKLLWVWMSILRLKIKIPISVYRSLPKSIFFLFQSVQLLSIAEQICRSILKFEKILQNIVRSIYKNHILIFPKSKTISQFFQN